jgi:predicted dehydrogenase
MIFGVIGVGKMGRNHVRVLNEIRKVEEIIIFDKDKELAKKVAKEFNAFVVEKLEDLLSACDAVSICSPTSLHYEHIKSCLKFDKHIFVEKPIASNYEEGKKILEMLEGKEIIFGVGHIERFNPIVSELKNLDIKVEYMDIKRHNPASARITDSTVVEDLMIHDIDLLFNVFFPERDYKIFSAGNKDLMQVIVNFGSSVASLSASRISSKKIRKLYIENSDMTIEGDFMTQELFIFKRPSVYQSLNEKYVQENVIEKILINKVEPLQVEIKTFINCIENYEEFPVTAKQAVNNLKICEMIWKAVH